MNSFLFGCFLVVVFGVKVFGKYLFEDPCEGSGNFRDPVTFYEEEEEEESNENDMQMDLNKIKNHLGVTENDRYKDR